jgi:hypothetical protein
VSLNLSPALYFRGGGRVRVRVEPIICVRQFPHQQKKTSPAQTIDRQEERKSRLSLKGRRRQIHTSSVHLNRIIPSVVVSSCPRKGGRKGERGSVLYARVS